MSTLREALTTEIADAKAKLARYEAGMKADIELLETKLAGYEARVEPMLSKDLDEVKDFFTDKVFNTLIPRTVRLSEAPSFGKPVTLYDPNGKGAEAYMNLAKEVIDRD